MTLEVVPLGGLGEFGMHMMAFRSNGAMIVVDAGVMFPDEELLGIDIIVPDITDLHTLAAYGDQGVLALFSDSTNAEHAGYTASERSVNDRFESIFRTSKGRVVLSCFTSSIPRLQLVIDQAKQYGRFVAFLGRRMTENTEIAQELGFLKIPPGLVIRSKEIRSYPRNKVCVVAGGCQAEPMSALSRLALDDHKDLKIEEGDTVVLSSRQIPGNERAIGRMMDHFYRRRAEMYYADGSQPPVHVSGHASEEELKLVVTLVKPKYFVPIHGTYRQLHRHAKLVEKTSVVGEKIIVAETGDVLRFGPAGAEIAGKAPVGRVLIDEGSLEEVEEVVIRDRRHISEDGIILAIIAINKQSGMMEIPPEIVFRGVAFLDEERLLNESRQMLFDTVNNATVEERGDWTVIKEKIRKDLKKFFYKQTAKRPFILPVILET